MTDRLAKAAADNQRAQADYDTTRAELREAVLEALAGGMKQVEAARITGYTRERLRQISRAEDAKSRS